MDREVRMGVRMHGREQVGLFLLGREDGMTVGEVGASVAPGCVLHSDRGWHYRTPD